LTIYFSADQLSLEIPLENDCWSSFIILFTAVIHSFPLQVSVSGKVCSLNFAKPGLALSPTGPGWVAISVSKEEKKSFVALGHVSFFLKLSKAEKVNELFLKLAAFTFFGIV
jgi:hypothetical protein